MFSRACKRALLSSDPAMLPEGLLDDTESMSSEPNAMASVVLPRKPVTYWVLPESQDIYLPDEAELRTRLHIPDFFQQLVL